MNLVLEQFDAIVTNVANSYRLQEECDVLSLVLSKLPGSIFSPTRGLPSLVAVSGVSILRITYIWGSMLPLLTIVLVEL